MGACCETNQRQASVISKNPFANFDLNFLDMKYDKNQEEKWSNVLLGQELISMIIKAKTSREVIKHLEQMMKVQPIVIEQIRYKNEKYEIFIEDERINTSMWNPIQFAIANPNKLVDLVKYMIEKISCNTSLCLREPLYKSELDGVVFKGDLQTDFGHFWNSILGLQLGIQNADTNMLDYLWNDLYFLWDISDLDQLIDSLYNHDFLDALSIILKGKAFRQIILSLSFEEQVFYLEKLLFDKFDKDTQFSVSPFIDDALATSKHFGCQYLYVNLKREYLLKDLLDVCLHNSNHYMIYQNADLFQWVFENMDKNVRANELSIMETLINNIVKGSKNVIELKFVHEELLRATRTGDLKKINRLVEHGQIAEIAQIKDKEGIVLLNFEEMQEMQSVCQQPNKSIISTNSNNSYQDEDILKEWNPLHIAIFFNQLTTVRYFYENMKINIQQAIKAPGQKKQHKKYKQVNQQQIIYQESSQEPSHLNLYFLIECFKFNIRSEKENPDQILRYFWENHGYLFGEVDLKYLIEYLFRLQKEELLSTYMYIPTTVYLIKSLPFEKRLIYLKELQYIGYQVNNINKGSLLEGAIQVSPTQNSPMAQSFSQQMLLKSRANRLSMDAGGIKPYQKGMKSNDQSSILKSGGFDINTNSNRNDDLRSLSSSPNTRQYRSIKRSDQVNRVYFDGKQLSQNESYIQMPKRSVIDQTLVKNQDDSNMQLMTELLCERPYSLYSMLLCLDRGNVLYFKQAYSKINAQDLEELIRCSKDRAINLVRIMKASQNQQLQQRQQEIQNFEEIRDELYELAERISKSPLIQFKMKQRKTNKLEINKAINL